MAKVTVHAGDWAKGGEHSFMFGSFSLRPHGGWTQQTIPASALTSLEVASEESAKRLGGVVGWGAVGALALGPVGLLAGLLGGGNKKDVTFVAMFDDGRKMLATTDSKAFTKMQAALFDKANPQVMTTQPAASALSFELPQAQMDAILAQTAADARIRAAEMWPFLTDADLDQYESLNRQERYDDAVALLNDRQFEHDVQKDMKDVGFTEEEARYYHSNILNESMHEELGELMNNAFSRKFGSAEG